MGAFLIKMEYKETWEQNTKSFKPLFPSWEEIYSDPMNNHPDEKKHEEFHLLAYQCYSLYRDIQNTKATIRHCEKVLKNVRAVRKELLATKDNSYLYRLRVHFGHLNDCFKRIESLVVFAHYPLDTSGE